MKYIISLDIGTTVVKTVLFSLDGREKAVFEEPIGLVRPGDDRVEQDPGELLRACELVLRKAVGCLDGAEALAIGISAQGGSLVPADRNGDAVGNLVTWMDTRAAHLVEEWKQDGTSARLRGECGWAPQPGLPLSVIAWLREHDADLFARTERWMSVNDYVVHHLTGEYVTNLSCAAEMMLVDLATDDWSEPICADAGIKRELLSQIRPSHAVAGPLNDRMKRILGISGSLAVVNGGQDHSCEALALGVNGTGTGMLACGTAWVINVALEDKDMDLVPGGMDLNYHVVPERYIASEFLGGYGKQIEWWVSDIACGLDPASDRDDLYKAFNEVLAETAMGASGVRYDAVNGRFLDVGPGKDLGDLSRGLLEGLVWRVHQAVADLRTTGVELNELWLIGGASRNAILPQMIADALDLEVRMTSYTHGPALGAAMLALLAIGEAKSPDEARERFSLEAESLMPDAARHEQYGTIFKRYKEMDRYE